MERIAFTLHLLPGNVDEYRQRHDELWPELATLLREAGIRDYSIFLDAETDTLFATLQRTADHGMASLPLEPIMQRWWAHMADLMITQPDNEPVSRPLERLFYLP